MKTHWLAVALSLGAFATPAQAAPLDRFYAPSTPSGLRAMATGPDGRVWLALHGAIGAIDRDGTIVSYPTGGLTPRAITAGPDGAVWFLSGGKLARLAPGSPPTIVARGLIEPSSVLAGPDGALWVAERDDVARVAQDGTLRRLGLGAVMPYWLASGPDGNVWFTGRKGFQTLVGRLTPQGDAKTYRTLLHLKEWAPAIVAGPDGNLWAATGLPVALMRVTPAGAIATVDVDDAPQAVAVAPDGALWMTGLGAVLRRAPDGRITRYTDPFGVGRTATTSWGLLRRSPSRATARSGRPTATAR